MEKKPIQRSETQKYLDEERQLFAFFSHSNMTRERLEIEQSRIFSEYLQKSTTRDFGYDVFSDDIWLTKKERHTKHTRYTTKAPQQTTQSDKSKEKKFTGNMK